MSFRIVHVKMQADQFPRSKRSGGVDGFCLEGLSLPFSADTIATNYVIPLKIWIVLLRSMILACLCLSLANRMQCTGQWDAPGLDLKATVCFAWSVLHLPSPWKCSRGGHVQSAKSQQTPRQGRHLPPSEGSPTCGPGHNHVHIPPSLPLKTCGYLFYIISDISG